MTVILAGDAFTRGDDLELADLTTYRIDDETLVEQMETGTVMESVDLGSALIMVVQIGLTRRMIVTSSSGEALSIPLPNASTPMPVKTLPAAFA